MVMKDKQDLKLWVMNSEDQLLTGIIIVLNESKLKKINLLIV